MFKEQVVVVTRHPALVEYLKELGIEGRVIPHASEEDVKGKHVFGVLPYRLANKAMAFTEVTMEIPLAYRGKELSLDDIKSFNPQLRTYYVYTAEDMYSDGYPEIEEMF